MIAGSAFADRHPRPDDLRASGPVHVPHTGRCWDRSPRWVAEAWLLGSSGCEDHEIDEAVYVQGGQGFGPESAQRRQQVQEIFSHLGQWATGGDREAAGFCGQSWVPQELVHSDQVLCWRAGQIFVVSKKDFQAPAQRAGQGVQGSYRGVASPVLQVRDVGH